MVFKFNSKTKKELNKIFRHLVSVCGDMDHVYEGFISRGDDRLEDNFKNHRLDLRKAIKKIQKINEEVLDSRAKLKISRFVKKFNKSLLRSDWDPELTPDVVELANLIYHSQVQDD